MIPWRRRLIEELQLQRKAEATIEADVAAVADWAKFLDYLGRYAHRLAIFAPRLAPRYNPQQPG